MNDLILKVKDIHIGNGESKEGVTLQEAVVAILRDSLRLEVDEITQSNYTGGFDGRPLYEDTKTIKIRLMADIEDQSHQIDEIDFDTN